jgi:hypothetical protein
MEDHVTSAGAIDNSCRLCGAAVRPQFSLRLLKRHDVSFSRCEHCGSLQSERPFWLEEAYSQSNLAQIDVGAAQRNFSNAAIIVVLARILRLQSVVDFGGGDGLLCRLVRDYGVNCTVQDRYAKSTYAQGFTYVPGQAVDLLSAFEVVEHYANPKEDLKALFVDGPDAVLISTAIYEGQGADWWYLTPESGQHIFFYTRSALRLIAHQNGYDVRFCGNYTLFLKLRAYSGLRKRLATVALHPLFVRFGRALIGIAPAPGVRRDFNSIA